VIQRLLSFLTTFAFVLGSICVLQGTKAQPVPEKQQPPAIEKPAPEEKIIPQKPVDPELEGIQVPIPKEMRIFNKSGSQCVWVTAEMLGNYHHVQGTQRLQDQYRHATGPGEFSRVMNQRNVKFKQVVGRDLDFIEEWVTNKKMGCGIGIHNTHVILICHFERNKLVKIIDNSDRSLRVQTWDWNRFSHEFSGWAFVILPDNTPQSEVSTWNNNVDDGRLYR